MKKEYERDLHYKLIGKKPVLVKDIAEWGKCFEKENRSVAKTVVEGGKEEIEVSTVFLGMDHGHGIRKGKPVLFETMVFGGKLNQDMERYTSWAAAEKGHKRMVKEVMKTIVPEHIPQVQHTKYLAERKKKEC